MVIFEEKKLLLEEKRVLLLYRELIEKEYDVTRNIKYDDKELVNHVEMQNAIYLMDSLLWRDSYVFTLEKYGPKSHDLEVNLNEIDKNKENIKSFYNKLGSNTYSNESKEIFKQVYDNKKLKKLEKFSRIASQVIETEKGIELLGNLSIIGMSKMNNANFQIINKKLQELRPEFDNNFLNQYAYNILYGFDLINSNNIDYKKVKRLNY